MATLNQVFLIGRLTRDPEIRRVASGTAVTEFSIAINRYYNDSSGERKEETSFIDVVIWGKKAETFTEYMGKGEEVLIMGRIKQDRWKTANDENRSKIRVICENFQFLSRRRSGGDGGDGGDGGGGQDYNRGSQEDLNSNFDDPGAVPF